MNDQGCDCGCASGVKLEGGCGPECQCGSAETTPGEQRPTTEPAE